MPKAKECRFCGHWYLEPCDERRAEECPNPKLIDAGASPKKKAKKR